MTVPAPSRCRFRWALIAACLLALISPTAARAHQASDGYVSLVATNQELTARVDLAVRDLDAVFGLDDNVDGSVTWGELTAHQAEIAQYVRTNVTVKVNDRLIDLTPLELLVDEHGDASFAVWRFKQPLTEKVRTMEIRYRCVFEVDALHRAFLKLEGEGEVRTGMLSPSEDSCRASFGAGAPRPHGLHTFIREGIWHIWTGYDHVLFLLALLLPAVVARVEGEWRAVNRLRPALWSVLKTVTAFTAAHSLTLSLAALGWVRMSPRIVEPVIAASVVLAAINNLRPFFLEKGWMVAFVFGLIHGFGFAGALQEMDLAGGSLAWPLLGFNLGVECGQAVIVLAFVPCAFLLRRSRFYQIGALRFGSIGITLVATRWLALRLLGG
ncbi:MAG: HupE/UreJ family protein [Verrucomicrobia bacterium]|nr:HupE/UreJ family protein [Verrucomicrobiota bacterium]MBI3868787.1 HupE/UreJ family protein [Verrucomicrobiota bacterium]